MSEPLVINLQFDQDGQATQVLQDMAKTADDLSKKEEEYQKRLAKRVGLIEEAKRMQADLIALGLKPAPLTAEQQYQGALDRTIRALEQKKRLEEDLIRLGHKQAPMAPKSAEDQYQEALARRVGSINQNNRMQADLIALGLKQDPAQAKQQADQRANQERQDRKREQDQMATWLALLAGEPTKAVITGFMGIGKASTLAIAGMMAFQGIVRATTDIANVQNNSSLTSGQKSRSTGRALGFGWLIDFVDAVDGTTERVRELNEYIHPQQQIALQGRLEKERTMAPIRLETASAYEGAWAIRNYIAGGSGPGLTAPFFDRTTAASERQYERYSRLEPLQIAKQKAIREMERSQGVTRAANNFWDEAADNTNDANRRVRVAAFRLNMGVDSDSKATRIEKLQEYQRLLTESVARQEMLEQRVNDAKEARLRQAHAEHAVRQADVEIQKEELSLLKERETGMTSRARSFGAGTRLDFDLAKSAFETLQKHGPDALTPEMLARAQQIAPLTSAKAFEARYERWASEGGFNKRLAAAEGEADTLATIRQQIQEKQLAVNIAVTVNELDLATRITNALDGIVKSLMISIENKARAKAGQQWAQQQERNAQGN